MSNKIIPYTVKEKLLLTNLVDKYKLVESKKTDAATIQKKNEEWMKIAEEYNSRGDIISQNRNSIQLKTLWNNLKQRKRKAVTELKYQRLATGGGPEPHVEIDPVMQAVNVAAPYADVTLECQWDSTAILENQILHLNSAPDIPEIITIPSSATTIMDTPIINIQNNKTPNTKMSNSEINSSNKNSRLMNLNTEAGLRIKKMQDAIQQQEELHRLRMKIEEEQLNTTVANKEKVEAERDLALLKLFKSSNNII